MAEPNEQGADEISDVTNSETRTRGETGITISPDSLPAIEMPKIQARIHVKRGKELHRLVKSLMLDIQIDFEQFKQKIEGIVASNASLPDDYMFDLNPPTIRLFCTWKPRTLTAARRVPMFNEFVELVGKDDYDVIINDVFSCHHSQKNGIEKNCLYILGSVQIAATERETEQAHCQDGSVDMGVNIERVFPEEDVTLTSPPKQRVYSITLLKCSNI